MWNMKKTVIILLVFSQMIFSQDISYDLPLLKEYFILLIDLMNSNTNGYKSHWLDIDIKNNILKSKGTTNINFSQGSISFTNRELDFAILGEGFFKIILHDGTIAYTRNGEFLIDEETNELVTINGEYKLYDTIKIKLGYTKLIFTDDHSIITIYPNDEEINNGKLLIYTLDTNKLKYKNDYNVNLHTNFFLYNGNDENINNDKIINKFIELSNVFRIATMVRIVEISRLLGMEQDWSIMEEE
jgi:flagellar basal body rod protein FlgG